MVITSTFDDDHDDVDHGSDGQIRLRPLYVCDVQTTTGSVTELS